MKVNPVGRILSEVQRAYLAGLMDGDGAIMACIEPHKEKRFKFRIRVSLKITLSSKADIEWIRNLTGVGYVRKNQRTFEWVVRDRSETKWMLKMLRHYFHSKNKQAKIALRILDSSVDTAKALYQVACLADTLSSFNVRSKSRRRNFATMIPRVFPVTT